MVNNEQYKNLVDRFEALHILCEVLYLYLPEKERILALTEAAERIQEEVYEYLEEK